MLKERRLWLVVALFVGDTVAAVAALGAAFVVRFWTDLIPAPLGVPPLDPYLLLVLPLVPLHALSMRVVGLYEYRHERTKADEAFLVAQGASLAIHFGNKAGLAARHRLAEHPGDVVAGRDQQRLQQLTLG